MTVTIALDGDEAGQKAADEIIFKVLDLSDTEVGYIRNRVINGQSIEESVRSLTNWELADELSYWDKTNKINGLPDWWHEMCEEHRLGCLGEITRRSRKLNDLGGIEYIRTFNADNSITDILTQYGVNAVPGRTTKCLMHDDSSPSLSISKDNGRAFCFNQSCALWHDGHGVDPFELNKILSK